MSTEERLARLEEGYTHLATKAGQTLESGSLALRAEVKALATPSRSKVAAIIQAGSARLSCRH